MSASLLDAVGEVIEANDIRARQVTYPAAGRQEGGPETNERISERFRE
jgi:hypothetical protein